MCVIWQNRLCIIDVDGTWMMSAVGRYGDFDFAPPSPSKDTAIAGVLPSEPGSKVGIKTKVLLPLDENRLLFLSDTGDIWVLTGNLWENGRIDRYAPEASNRQRTAPE